jgi:signal transduction histidine kinase
VVSHAISVTVLQARGARATLGRDEAQVRRALDAIEQTNTAALGDMRRLLAVLRDVDSDGQADHGPQPTLAHLDTLLDQVRGSGVPVVLEVTGEEVPVPPGVDLSAYRIVQEALTNVIKHADGAQAVVRLQYTPDELHVSVTDDGPGASAVEGTGHGLIGIRERVAVVGGSVEAGPRTTGGFTVQARLPYFVEVS